MKVCLIGCVEFSADALKKLFELEKQNICEVVGVITKQSSEFNADFVDLGQVLVKSKMPRPLIHYYQSDKKASEFILQINADVIYCFGWSFLLGKVLLDTAPKGVIGFHPADLPQNRGRNPIIWALTLGLSETASSFFRMDEGADSGPILSQEIVKISNIDNARSLYDKITRIALRQIEAFTIDLSESSGIFQPQNNKKANYWRKRSPKDGVIDWRMEAEQIHNLIRALSPPYPGAEIHLPDTNIIKVWKSHLVQKEFPRNFEPGKVLAREGARLLVKCGGDGALWIDKINPQPGVVEGEYL